MSSEKDKEKELENLKQKLRSLNIDITQKGEFEKKFLYYKENWRSLVETD